MVIIGVAFLAVCTVGGLLIGEVLGYLLGVQANVGGVGIAMLLFIFGADWLLRRGLLGPLSQRGIEFWAAIYVPIVVGMAAQQNVVGAIDGGPVAILAGLGAVGLGLLLVPLITGPVDPADVLAPEPPATAKPPAGRPAARP